MTPRQLTAVILRICGILLILTSLPWIASWIEWENSVEEWAEYDAGESKVEEESFEPDAFEGESEEPEVGFLDEESDLSTYSYTASEVFPGFAWQVGIQLSLGLLLIFFCRPMAGLVLIGIEFGEAEEDSKKKNP